MVVTARDIEIKADYKLTEVGIIPEDWEVTSIGEVAFVTKLAGFEYTKHFDYRQTGPIIAIRALNIKNGMLDLTEVQTIPLETSKSLPRSQLAKGDLVISYVGALLGQVAVIPEDNKFHLAPNVAKIRVNPKQLNQLFLSQYLNGEQGQCAIYESIASSGQPALSMRTLREITIIFPPLLEQQAIATALSDIDALITSLDKLIAKKRDIKQATMQQLLTGKTRLPGFCKDPKPNYKQTEFGAIPEDWELAKIGDYAFVTKLAGFEYTNHFDYRKSGPIIAIRALNIKDGKLDLTDVHTIPFETSKLLPRSQLAKGDLVISYVGTLGRVAVILEDGKFHLAPNVAKIRTLPNQVNPFYLCHFLNGERGQNAILKAAASTTQSALSMQNLREITFICPSLSEQEAIATVLSDMDAEITALELKRDKTRALKQGMMQELLTGKTRLI